jgi:hypothetical protein
MVLCEDEGSFQSSKTAAQSGLFYWGETSGPLNVRFGSKADIGVVLIYVRYSPKSGHRLSAPGCPLCAKSRLRTAHCLLGPTACVALFLS